MKLKYSFFAIQIVGALVTNVAVSGTEELISFESETEHTITVREPKFSYKYQTYNPPYEVKAANNWKDLGYDSPELAFKSLVSARFYPNSNWALNVFERNYYWSKDEILQKLNNEYKIFFAPLAPKNYPRFLKYRIDVGEEKYLYFEILEPDGQKVRRNGLYPYKKNPAGEWELNKDNDDSLLSNLSFYTPPNPSGELVTSSVPYKTPAEFGTEKGIIFFKEYLVDEK